MALQYFTLFHVLISLAAIGAGCGALSGWLAGRLFPRWNAWFLAATAATSVTGFFFPFHGFTPAIGVGVVSLAVTAAAAYAWFVRRLAGLWRAVFVISSVAALYLNAFVLLAQLFQKTPALLALAPTQSEPPFAGAQGTLLVLFVALGIAAARRFRTE